jgi:hypothetical protein
MAKWEVARNSEMMVYLYCAGRDWLG